MRKLLASSLLCAVALAGGSAVAATPPPAAGSSPPPQIYRIKVRPLCSALHGKIAPAVGMMLQNDATIAKSPKLFDEYSQGGLEVDAQDPDHNASARQNLSVMRLENLVSPLANNILAVQKILEDPAVFPAGGRTEDEKALNDIKKKMLISLATQQASLDIINGFVDTQQLDAMQHEGYGFIQSVAAGDIGRQGGQSQQQALSDMIGPTSDPLHPQTFDQTALNAGLATNPYEMDLSRLPGLSLGYNPVGRLKEGVVYTQKQAQKTEKTLAASVIAAKRLCDGASNQGITTPVTPSP